MRKRFEDRKIFESFGAIKKGGGEEGWREVVAGRVGERVSREVFANTKNDEKKYLNLLFSTPFFQFNLNHRLIK